MKIVKSSVLKLNTPIKRLMVHAMKPFANNFILLNPQKKAKRNCVNVDYWDGANLGDAISPVVVNYMLRQKGLSMDTNVNGTKH